MPWQSCTINDKSELYKTSAQQDKPKNKTSLIVEPRPSLVFNGNKKIGEPGSNSLFESLALSLKFKDSPMKKLNRELTSPVETRFDVMISPPKEKTNEKRQTDNSKIGDSGKSYVKNMVQVSDQVEFYDSDFNVTVDDDDEGLEFDEQQETASDQYAYIVVPIKISKNRKLPGLNPSSAHETNRRKNKKVQKEPKNLEGMTLIN